MMNMLKTVGLVFVLAAIAIGCSRGGYKGTSWKQYLQYQVRTDEEVAGYDVRNLDVKNAEKGLDISMRRDGTVTSLNGKFHIRFERRSVDDPTAQWVKIRSTYKASYYEKNWSSQRLSTEEVSE